MPGRDRLDHSVCSGFLRNESPQFYYGVPSASHRLAAVGAETVISPESNRGESWEYDLELNRQRNLIEWTFNKLKPMRRIATRN